MAKPTIIIKGIKSSINYLNKKNKEFRKAALQGLKQASVLMVTEVKESVAGRRAEPTSVDTGRFMNSITYKIDGFSSKIFSPLKYPIYLEEGTSVIKPRRHFKNTKARNQSKAMEIIRNKINKA